MACVFPVWSSRTSFNGKPGATNKFPQNRTQPAQYAPTLALSSDVHRFLHREETHGEGLEVLADLSEESGGEALAACTFRVRRRECQVMSASPRVGETTSSRALAGSCARN